VIPLFIHDPKQGDHARNEKIALHFACQHGHARACTGDRGVPKSEDQALIAYCCKVEPPTR